MKARELAGLGHALHITPHGLQGHAQFVGQLFDRHRAEFLDHFEQGDLARIGIHGADFRWFNRPIQCVNEKQRTNKG